jgi:hypothetical protein
MAQGDAVLRLEGIVALASTDIVSKDPVGQPRNALGQLAWCRDRFGALRLFNYRRNISGSAFAVGDLASKKKYIVTNLDSGTTLTATKAATFTADEMDDAAVIVQDKNSSAGAAPEGEVTVARSGTAATLTFYDELPLSTALLVNDDLAVFTRHAIDAADGDFNHVVVGVAMAAAADDEYCWFQMQGLHPRVAHKATDALVLGDPVVADAAAVGAWGADTARLWVGWCPATYANDVVGNKGPVVMSLFPAYF